MLSIASVHLLVTHVNPFKTVKKEIPFKKSQLLYLFIYLFVITLSFFLSKWSTILFEKQNEKLLY